MTSTPSPTRSTAVPRTIALLGLLGMLVLFGFEVQALTWESGDRVLHLSYAGIAVASVSAVAAAWWTAWASRKGGAITVLVIAVLINPIWLLLLIRAFG
ncbi:MAG: hypothetical protein Q8M65_08375 [Rhodoglobus sp.]|nr:hypothetical protein [Rhodoglobus sp.]